MAEFLISALIWLTAIQGTPPQTTDHSLFSALLQAHVSPEGLVDYDAFARNPKFTRYLRQLSTASLEPLSERERLALWINAYNAYTIELINRHQERSSIRNINRTLGFFRGKGPWKERFAEVAGETWTLDEIEHEIIRERFSEPRIHFALVCGALGCPPLRNEAYRAEELKRQLHDQARAFLLESPAKNRVETGEGVVYLSPIFDWYREDFPRGRRGLGEYLAEIHPPGPERDLLRSGRFQVEFTEYDWKLNGVGDGPSTPAIPPELRPERTHPRSPLHSWGSVSHRASGAGPTGILMPPGRLETRVRLRRGFVAALLGESARPPI